VLVLYARDRLGMCALGFGLITTAMAVGGLLGAASYGWLERHVRLGVIMRGGLVASVWGVTAPFWLAFAGSALILAVIWRSPLHIAHADEHARTSAPA